MTPVQLREVLYRFDIIMADKQFNALVAEMDGDGDGTLSYREFMQYFGVGSEHDKNVVGTITGISVDDAITMIRDKVRGRLRSGPSELRRTFQFFDRDGSGYVDFEEMAGTLELSCGIKFEDVLLKQVSVFSVTTDHSHLPTVLPASTLYVMYVPCRLLLALTQIILAS